MNLNDNFVNLKLINGKITGKGINIISDRIRNSNYL